MYRSDPLRDRRLKRREVRAKKAWELKKWRKQNPIKNFIFGWIKFFLALISKRIKS